ARGLRRDPWYALAGIVLVALGVGANAGIFSVVNAAFFRPLPYPAPDRLVSVLETRRGHLMRVAGANYLDWEAQADGFTALAGYFSYPVVFATGDRPEQLTLAAVSRSFATVLGRAPRVGRWFSADEARPGGPPVVVVSWRLWRDRLGADSAALGTPIRVDGRLLPIVGVLPPEADLPVGADLWVPLEPFLDGASRTGHNYDVVGRLQPDVSAEAAERSLTLLTRRVTVSAPPSEYLADGVRVLPLRETLLGETPGVLRLLQAAVALLLLVAVLNLATLLLARAAKRQSETSLMLALGASGRDLAQRSVVESLLVTALGAGLGLGLWLLVRPVVTGPVVAAVRFVRDLPLDFRVIGFVVGVIVAAGLLAGVVPALWSARATAGSSAAAVNRFTGASRPMRLLVAGEVALTFLLLAAAGLLGRSLARLLDQPLGFDPSGRLAMSVSLPTQEGSPYRDHDRYRGFVTQLLDRVAAIPGVESVAAGAALPLLGSSPDGAARIQGEPSDAGGPAAVSELRVVSPGYFATLGIPLVAGREFESADQPGSPYVAVVNEAFARTHLRGESPLGRQVRFPGMDWSGADRWATVVGVVGDVRERGPASRAYPAIYYTFLQRPQPYRDLQVAVRLGRAGSAPVLEAMRRTLADLEPMVPFEGRTMDTAVGAAVAGPRLRMLVLTGFAAMALCLAGVGLFGVIGFVVLQRSREIGVRIALGASSRQVVLMALRHAAAPVALGLGVGVAMAVAFSRLLRGLLFGISTLDPVALGAAMLAIVVVTLVACIGPIRRALAVDPALALRPE
ncbi:MAG: ADOP family duplicated permease, partial [Gemmatimonadales bacterium]